MKLPTPDLIKPSFWPKIRNFFDLIINFTSYCTYVPFRKILKVCWSERFFVRFSEIGVLMSHCSLRLPGLPDLSITVASFIFFENILQQLSYYGFAELYC